VAMELCLVGASDLILASLGVVAQGIALGLGPPTGLVALGPGGLAGLIILRARGLMIGGLGP
jgi:hypothetical protein